MAETEYPKLSIDAEVNIAYLALSHIGRGEAAETIAVEDRDGSPMLLIDLSSDGRILGFEILGADERLPGAPA